jgi:hypothetical protein
MTMPSSISLFYILGLQCKNAPLVGFNFTLSLAFTSWQRTINAHSINLLSNVEYGALILFTIATSVTLGPNNMMIMTS